MVWGSMIAWYLFLAGASAGAFLTSAFVEAKYPDSVKMRVAGRIISPIFLGIGLLMLMLDAEAGLHNPLRFFYLIMNPGSVMTLGVYFICVFMPVSIAAALLEVLRRPVPKWLTWTGIVSAFCVAAYTGFLLGVVSAYPLWNNAILPVLFVVSALSAGLAATSLVGLITDRERFEQMVAHQEEPRDSVGYRDGGACNHAHHRELGQSRGRRIGCLARVGPVRANVLGRSGAAWPGGARLPSRATRCLSRERWRPPPPLWW